MSDQLIVTDVEGVTDIFGVHGATGVSHWKCLASRRHLHGDWEAVELARVPPGGLSGEHRHTRTEEIYYVVAGEGEMLLDGTGHRVGAGSVVLTGLGTIHGLRNTGTTDLDWITVEVRVPHPVSPLEEKVNARIHDLKAEGELDTTAFFTGPLRQVAVRTMAADTELSLHAVGVEHAVFVLAGSGKADAVELRPGVAVTLPLGTGAQVSAGPEGLEFFHVVLVAPRSRSQR
ncbi:hypothetical protein Vqi01_30480 [Micromonospora qiuiae]|uniref:Cupin type-2 domain-containing protein n=1 Tax=Micromonospora qiuiae TaxID=502268 RepID=A0ABQ4JCI7_9ACTN|nr:cupin domain-containing protein [Micromonospora qiuiae]GIJ27886.1 hypothetical protein Vqi01_30480 [Micromonospora qiuiae]